MPSWRRFSVSVTTGGAINVELVMAASLVGRKVMSQGWRRFGISAIDSSTQRDKIYSCWI
jgi:hypothetical protein